MTEVAKNIWLLEIELPQSPLKTVNCYLVKGVERNLLIDTGSSLPQCRNALLDSLEKLGADIGRTDVLLTHMHSDHSGNAKYFSDMGCRIFMNHADLREISAE